MRASVRFWNYGKKAEKVILEWSTFDAFLHHMRNYHQHITGRISIKREDGLKLTLDVKEMPIVKVEELRDAYNLK